MFRIWQKYYVKRSYFNKIENEIQKKNCDKFVSQNADQFEL